MTNPKSRAFTLIELLVVVGIIAILAAIAVPNFLEAQTRSKVARVKADLRTVATAMEAYFVDTNHYPPDWNSLIYGPVDPLGEWKSYQSLSTPVAYITSAPSDIYRDNVHGTDNFYEYYGEDANVYFGGTDDWKNYNIHWVVYSFGPNQKNERLGTYTDTIKITYDPTNGTVSAGDLGRTNKGEIRGEP